jgi:integrase
MKAKITFEQQAERFLKEGETRKRSPLRPASIRTYRAQIDNHLNPLIGKTLLKDVGNKALSELVQKLSEKGLSARTIALNVVLVKKIRKSATNEDGDSLYPQIWNPDVIDAPEVDTTKQPILDAQAISGVLSKESKAADHRKVLYALLASTGMRIAEALAIQVIPDDKVSTVWVPSESKITIRQQMTREGLAPTKTRSGNRDVDLNPELNDFLVKNANTFNGFMFPEAISKYRDSLIKDGITSGFHAFRRFRITHLESQGVPRALAMAWTGHGAKNVHETYINFGESAEVRKSWCVKAGLGFKLPEAV